MMSTEINDAIIAKAPNCHPGDVDYVKLYAKTWSEVTDSLSLQKREEFEELARKWNTGGLPQEIKSRYTLFYQIFATVLMV